MPNGYNYDDYMESEEVRRAREQLEQQLAQKPGAYQSQWQQQMDEILNRIQNREKFSYDLNGDALYQQYKDQYMTQGKMAMMDTMGQAAALTGGYGNSYAQGVGQQAYQGYLQQLNNQVPELYQLALDQYNREGDDLYNRFALLGDRESMDYSRYRDSVSDYNAELDRLQNQYNAERDFDYGKYTDNRDFNYGAYRDSVADSQWQQEFQEAMRQWNENFRYQQQRDAVSDEQWEREFEEAMRQWQESFEYQQGRDAVSDEQWQQEFDEARRKYGGGSSGGNEDYYEPGQEMDAEVDRDDYEVTNATGKGRILVGDQLLFEEDFYRMLSNGEIRAEYDDEKKTVTYLLTR